MNRFALKPLDYEKIIHFAAQIARPVENIRLSILHELASIFGYHNTILWKTDHVGNISSPTLLDLREPFIHEYLTEFYAHDILNPQKHFTLFREKKIVTISDILSVEQYETSTYYQSFMKKYGFYDEMGISLIYEGKLIGIMGMAKKKEHNRFTVSDYKRFELLSNLIASALARQFDDESDYSFLSKREEEVVKLLKEGKTNQLIAEELHISINTVKKHLQNIYHRNSVKNRIQLLQKLK